MPKIYEFATANVYNQATVEQDSDERWICDLWVMHEDTGLEPDMHMHYRNLRTFFEELSKQGWLVVRVPHGPVDEGEYWLQREAQELRGERDA